MEIKEYSGLRLRFGLEQVQNEKLIIKNLIPSDWKQHKPATLFISNLCIFYFSTKIVDIAFTIAKLVTALISIKNNNSKITLS